MGDITIEGVTNEFRANVKKQALTVEGVFDLPQVSLRKIFEYGLQQLLNDAGAGGKTVEESIALAEKRWDNLLNGVLRASRVGGGDPVAREAMRIAIAKIKVAPKYVAWLAENNLKATDKAATDKLRELAEGLAQREEIIKIAEKNVKAAEGVDIDIDI